MVLSGRMQAFPDNGVPHIWFKLTRVYWGGGARKAAWYYFRDNSFSRYFWPPYSLTGGGGGGRLKLTTATQNYGLEVYFLQKATNLSSRSSAPIKLTTFKVHDSNSHLLKVLFLAVDLVVRLERPALSEMLGPDCLLFWTLDCRITLKRVNEREVIWNKLQNI